MSLVQNFYNHKKFYEQNNCPLIHPMPIGFSNVLLDTNGEFIATSNQFHSAFTKDKLRQNRIHTIQERYNSNKPFIHGHGSYKTNDIADIRKNGNFHARFHGSNSEELNVAMSSYKSKINKFDCPTSALIIDGSDVIYYLRQDCKLKVHYFNIFTRDNQIFFEAFKYDTEYNKVAGLPLNCYLFKTTFSVDVPYSEEFFMSFTRKQLESVWNDDFRIRICKDVGLEFISSSHDVTLYIEMSEPASIVQAIERP